MDNRIKDLRDDFDLTQQQIADATGITQRNYSYIETGTQPLTDELLVKLANQVSIDYLLRQINNPKRNKQAVHDGRKPCTAFNMIDYT